MGEVNLNVSKNRDVWVYVDRTLKRRYVDVVTMSKRKNNVEVTSF